MTKKAKAQLNKTVKAVEEIDMLREMKALVVALRKEICSLSSELEHTQRGFAEIDDARAKAALYEAALYDSLKSEIEDLEDDKETLNDEIETLKNENDDLRYQNRDLEAELDLRKEAGRGGYDEGYDDGHAEGYDDGREAEGDQNRMGA